MRERSVSLRRGAFEIPVLEGGSGDPLLFLHGSWAIEWGPFHDALAQRHRVIAPILPGFGESSGAEQLLDIHDLIYCELDLLDALGLTGLPLVGHSLGGMVAAELAAVQPQRFTQLVLIGPLGLWNEAHPVPDFFTFAPTALAGMLYADPDSPQAQAIAVTPTEDEAMIQFQLERAKSMAASARFLWPIPNRGLSKRLHRATMPTLLIWGERDGVCPPAYAEDFKALLPNARVELIPVAAHMPHLEQPEKLAELIEGFLGAVPSP